MFSNSNEKTQSKFEITKYPFLNTSVQGLTAGKVGTYMNNCQSITNTNPLSYNADSFEVGDSIDQGPVQDKSTSRH